MDATRVLTTCHPLFAGQPGLTVNELTDGLHLARVEHVPVCSDHLEPCTARPPRSNERQSGAALGTYLTMIFLFTEVFFYRSQL